MYFDYNLVLTRNEAMSDIVSWARREAEALLSYEVAWRTTRLGIATMSWIRAGGVIGEAVLLTFSR